MAISSAILALAVACSKSDSVGEEPENENIDGIPVSLAFNLVDKPYPATKTTSTIAQADGTDASFRGMSEIHFLPFDVKGRDVALGDIRSHEELVLPYEGIAGTWHPDASDGNQRGLVSNNKSHLYGIIGVPKNTSTMLVYGKAADDKTFTEGTPEFKHRNGVLTADLSSMHSGEITFTPEQIVPEDKKADAIATAQRLADILNSLIEDQYTVSVYRRYYGWVDGNGNPYSYSFTWTVDYGNTALRNARAQLLDNGNMIAASGFAVTSVLQRLYRALYSAGDDDASIEVDGLEYDIYKTRSTGNPFTYRDLYMATIGARIEEYATVTGTGNNARLTLIDSELANFPGNIGLPDGCIGLQWDADQGKIVVRSEASPTLHIAPLTRFCYNPSLWYFANTQLKTAARYMDVHPLYVSSNATWESILSGYNLGSTVTRGVESAALIKPLQYATALFKFKLANCTSNEIPDREETNVAVNHANFPVTGVIVARQHRQNFAFQPLEDAEYYIYDTEVNNGTTPLGYLTSTATNNDIHSMVLQTPEGEDVVIVVEFRNNTNVTFQGATGSIPPGSKFYMLGTLKYENGTGDNKNLVKSVFQQDYITTATFRVNSLAKAYNCIPDLQEPQLELAVQIDVDWILATPTNVPLY
ncbi:MAG: hypothetical protein IJ855_07620 [Bacteroidales bacterium]|nr:hypothetical protein [Bacteroidales bacterium]